LGTKQSKQADKAIEQGIGVPILTSNIFVIASNNTNKTGSNVPLIRLFLNTAYEQNKWG
jgi:hypothetical protein